MTSRRHILSVTQFEPKFLSSLFRLADELEQYPEPLLHGKILASLFYEPSTRTRFSFESACLRLGGRVVSTENAREFSSAAKGESIEDTVRVVGQYADAIVLRHFEDGAADRAASVSPVPIINAGDGAGEHPTQALLDLYTIAREFGRVENFSIAFVGDIKNGRTVRSLALLLSLYANVTLYFIAPKAFQLKDDIRAVLEERGVEMHFCTSLGEVLGSVDVLYMTRLQGERLASGTKKASFQRPLYRLDKEDVTKMKAGALVMHPLPRNDEIASDIDALPNAVYFRQTYYGLLVRQALLAQLLT